MDAAWRISVADEINRERFYDVRWHVDCFNLLFSNKAAGGSHGSCRDQFIFAAKRETESNASFSNTLDADFDVELVLETSRADKIAADGDTGPADFSALYAAEKGQINVT